MKNDLYFDFTVNQFCYHELTKQIKVLIRTERRRRRQNKNYQGNDIMRPTRTELKKR
jgi:hypothetical protein